MVVLHKVEELRKVCEDKRVVWLERWPARPHLAMFSVLHGHLLLQILELLVNLSTKNWKVPNHRAHNNITRNQSSRRWNVDAASIQHHWQKGGATRRTCLQRSRSSLHERLNSLSNSSMAGKTAARGWCGRGVILPWYSGSSSSSRPPNSAFPLYH